MKASDGITTLKWVYKVLRSLIFSTIIVFVAVLALLYVTLSIPPVQERICRETERQLSEFFGNPVEINHLTVNVPNEVILDDVKFVDGSGQPCISIAKIGAGVNFWKLIFRGKIEITYAELLGLKANVVQQNEGEPLNIDYIIKAFAPKDKNKPPTQFDLNIRNIVLRGGEISFAKSWLPARNDGIIDFNHLRVSNLSADVTIPVLKNDDVLIDLRRLSFSEQSGLQVKGISGLFKIVGDELKVTNLDVRLPESVIKTSAFSVSLKSPKDSDTRFTITDSRITPSNLAFILPVLRSFDSPFSIEANIGFNKETLSVTDFLLRDKSDFSLNIAGAYLSGWNHPESGEYKLDGLSLSIASSFAQSLVDFFPVPQPGKSTLNQVADFVCPLSLEASGGYEGSTGKVGLTTILATKAGNIALEASGFKSGDDISCDLTVDAPMLEFDNAFAGNPVKEVDGFHLVANASFNTKDFKNVNGNTEFSLSSISLFNRNIENITGFVDKHGADYSLRLDVEDDNLNGSVEASATLDGEDSEWNLMATLDDFDTYSSFLADSPKSGYEIKGRIEGTAKGNSLDNIVGSLKVSDLSVVKWNGNRISIPELDFSITRLPEGQKETLLRSGIADVSLVGYYIPSRIPAMVMTTLHETIPALFRETGGNPDCGEGTIDIAIKDAQPLISFFSLPTYPLTELNLKGTFCSSSRTLSFSTDVPYIRQGSNKLITGTYLSLRACGAARQISLEGGTNYPTKKGRLEMDIDLEGKEGIYDISVLFNKKRDVAFHGEMSLNVSLQKQPFTDKVAVIAHFFPSLFYLNDAEWKLDESVITYNDKVLEVDGFNLRHDNQFVTIDGLNQTDGEGIINVGLSQIDLDYLFDTLNINHVTFGGRATGNISAMDIFSNNPLVRTEYLNISNLSYNGALLGDGDVSAYLSLPEKKVAIGAVISKDKRRVATVDGGVWFGRDSLAFDFDADRVNVGFMQPFMSAFSSSISGEATGKALLYGTFSDINMTGTIVAHDVDILVDYINTRYSGSDTIYMQPGLIEIPHFEVHDKFGHTATLQGHLSHNYFHEPAFRFSLTDMDNLLVYDTNSSFNPLWYGTLYASGRGEIIGRPGLVRITADVVTGRGSDFTFVLSDQQEAVKSRFLSFTDRRKEEEEKKRRESIPSYLQPFYANDSKTEDSSDVFSMDFRVSVTDAVKFNLIMDPVADDRIVAYGNGAINMSYSSLTDELRLYGKYVLDKGSYNFSLQDIILKDFTIKPGSSIAFSGSPYSGVLDITAAYRVNTSLTELDNSFANDRELNRTSVPVEALLKVTGRMMSPTIGFDIELPTVTEETAQKVRSIISTEDMMSRQVLYLVALNKFYPPEYMSTSNSGGEWASIASSTISSQLQNMIGQLTDKFTLAPSIRSDKGDFSDIEVDLALSSQLFHNRLLINGNLGYRDPSNSSTTFVGDFDLEYLLNKKGSWRLKAYNHFNDQNYYLKSALTTQGIGIVWRKEFGLPRKKEPTEREESE